MNRDNDEANTLEREKIAEDARQFNKQLQFNREKLKEETSVKEKQIQATKQKNGNNK